MRPLVLHYENDPEVWNLNGEFLVGENLLAAPVLEQGETKRSYIFRKVSGMIMRQRNHIRADSIIW